MQRLRQQQRATLASGRGRGGDNEDEEGDEAAVVGGDVARGEAGGQMKNEPPKE